LGKAKDEEMAFGKDAVNKRDYVIANDPGKDCLMIDRTGKGHS
jgi:phage anti-repressor protein